MAASTSVQFSSPMAATAPSQNTLPITAASGSIDLRSAVRCVEAGGDQGTDRVGQGELGARPERDRSASLDEQVPVAQHAHELLGVEGVAHRPARGSAAESRRQGRWPKPAGDEPRCLLVRSGARLIALTLAILPRTSGWRSNSSGRAVTTRSSGTPSARSARCSRNASIASSAQWMSSNTRTVGPLVGDALEERPPGGERAPRAPQLSSASIPDERQEPRTQPVPVWPAGRSTSILPPPPRESRTRRMPGLGLDDLAQCPERHAVAVRQAAALAPREPGRRARDVGEQLADHPALADAGLADDRDELDVACPRRTCRTGRAAARDPVSRPTRGVVSDL